MRGRAAQAICLAGLVLWTAYAIAATDAPVPLPATTRAIERVSAHLNGVFSPRGFFNILVRLNEMPNAEAAKLDLKLARIEIDFRPGAAVTESQMEEVMREAGYRPGKVMIAEIAPSQASETGPGWMKIHHPAGANPLVRWMKENF